MQRKEILCILCDLFGEESEKEIRAAMLLAFQASGRHIDMPKRKKKRPKRQPKYKCSMIISKCVDIDKCGVPMYVKSYLI